MRTINVMVRDKIASEVGDIVYICGNSDYIINFDFDAEWDAYGVKTARFVHNGTYTDVVFTGNQCAMPVIHKAYGIFVGVYAGDLRTTTPAHIPSAASILSAEGTPAAPPDDVYAQITALCNEAVAEAKSVREDADAGKFNGAPGKTPEAGVDYFTEADKQAIAAEAAKEVGFPQPTSADNGKYLGCENGAAKWMTVDLPSGGAEVFELLTKNAETGEVEPIVMDAETLRYNFPSLADYKKLLIIIKKRYNATTGLTGNVWFKYNSDAGFLLNPSQANSYVEIDASLPGLCALKYLTSNNLQILNTPYNGTYTNVNSFESPYWIMPNTDWAEYYANCNTTITILGVRR